MPPREQYQFTHMPNPNGLCVRGSLSRADWLFLDTECMYVLENVRKYM